LVSSPLPRTPATFTQAMSKPLACASFASMPARVPSHTTRQPSPRWVSSSARVLTPALPETGAVTEASIGTVTGLASMRGIPISRAKSAVTFPARFQLIAAMNPCPCGQTGSRDQLCRCGPQVIERYLGKISGPLLDRIAIHVFVRPVELSAFSGDGARETSAEMRGQVAEARERQKRRVLVGESERADGSSRDEGRGGLGDGALVFLNARLPEKLVKKYCRLDDAGSDLLIRAQKQLRVSARGRGHLLRVSRTIADLEGSDAIRAAHVAEAVQYGVRETSSQ